MSETKPIYLDYNATTPLDPRVLDAMMPWFREPANAGSRTHSYGQRAKEAVETARSQVADVLGVAAQDIVFTSGATESNNLAILGLAAYGTETNRRHIVSTAIEHKAVLEPLQRMQSLGFEIELVKPTSGGFVEPEAIASRLRKDTLLVSVMHANNETGVLQPVTEIANLTRSSDALFHTDAAQTFGKEVEELRKVDADLISVSAHKVYGPQGIGALCVRRRQPRKRPIQPIAVGGGQERSLRPGTNPVALIVGFGQAAELSVSEHEARRQDATRLKHRLLEALKQVEHHINGDQRRTQSHVLNMRFPGVDSEALMMALRNAIAISNGSACTSSAYEPSHVLRAMGLSEDEAGESIRLSWGVGVSDFDVSPLTHAVEQTRVLL